MERRSPFPTKYTRFYVPVGSIRFLNTLGGNIVLTDDNQNPLVRYEYDVFGAIRDELADSELAVVKSAADALRKIGSNWLISGNMTWRARRDLLADSDPRRQAALAIAAIGAPAKEMVPVLVKMFRNQRSQPAALDRAVEDALVSIGESSVPALIPLLEDKDHWTRYSVSKLLKRIGTPEALRAVEAYEQRKNN